MLDLKYNELDLCISDSNKKVITFNTEKQAVLLDGFDITHPGEYEKSGILVEVKEFNEKLYYNFLVDGKRLVIIGNDSFELKEEILSFFGDVDILIIVGTKPSAKLFENIEAKLVIPYGEGKDLFLQTLGQHIEEESSYRVKGEFSLDSTDFVNLV